MASGDAGTVVLVHGNFLGPWVWDDVVADLRARGIDTRVADLPSSTSTGIKPAGDLYDDVEHVREILDALTGPVVVCGHSYGGVVVTEAAAGPHPAVGHLVYLAAVVPDDDESLNRVVSASEVDDTGEAEEETVVPRPDGMLELAPEAAPRMLFPECSPQRAKAAVERLRPSNPAVGRQPVRGAAWHSLPATYVHATNDRMPQLLSPGARESTIEWVEVDSGHCPHWGRPEAVGEILAERSRRLASRTGV